MLQKRLNREFNGYEVPLIPRAVRSARRRVPFRKKTNDDPMCAFDLLATVAGKLLEGESTPSSTDLVSTEDKNAVGEDPVKKEKLAEDNSEQVFPPDEEKCGWNLFVSENISQAPPAENIIDEASHPPYDACSAFASLVTTSDITEIICSAAKMSNDTSKIEHGMFSKVDAENYRSSIYFARVDVENKNCIKIEPPIIGKEQISASADVHCLEDQDVQAIKPHALTNVDNIVKLSAKPFLVSESSPKDLSRDESPLGSFHTCRDNVKLVGRDDDENSFGCTQPRILNKAFRPPPRIGDRRIKRLLASRYWKVTPKPNREDCFYTGLETKSVYANRANKNKRQRSLRDCCYKKRRLYDRSLATHAYGGVNSDAAARLRGSREGTGFAAHMNEANGTSTYGASQPKLFQPSDSHVKLKIKSFRVPELLFEIPETATIGSLKRTVMEAVTAVLGGGLRVGVLVQGKKIRDDNKTLVQTGIYDDSKNVALGFTLEPLSSQVSPPQCPENHAFVPPQQLARCPHTSIIVKHENSNVSPELPTTNFGNSIESDHDLAPSPLDMSIDKSMPDSRALVSGPKINAEAASALPMRKSKRLDISHRRIRRPFSVSEVEALVQAVENLGTGRWRDVKMRAFDNAKHRTYVDLKDKWKTLVHTARISPQQRRGEESRCPKNSWTGFWQLMLSGHSSKPSNIQRLAYSFEVISILR